MESQKRMVLKDIFSSYRKVPRNFHKETQFWRGFGRPRPIGQFLDSNWSVQRRPQVLHDCATLVFTKIIGHRLASRYTPGWVAIFSRSENIAKC